MSALAPRRNMVALHFLKGKMLAAVGAYPILPLVGFPFLLFRKCADIQMPLVAGEDIGVNSFLVRHIVVNHQRLDFRFQLVRV